MIKRFILITTGLVSLFADPAEARVRLRRPSTQVRHATTISSRKRLTVNDLIAQPGTVEIDWGGLYSYTNGILTLPYGLRFTPDGDSLLVGRTEYSVAFDSLQNIPAGDSRVTKFADRMTFAATSVVYGSDHFDVGFAPTVIALFRGDSGIRAGATTIARYDGGGNTIAATVSWSGATTASDTNPAGIWDLGAAFARPIRSKGFWSQFTPHVNLTLEKATGFERDLSIFGGIEYQLNPRFAIDFSGQRFGLTGGGKDRQVFVGLTVNLGRLMP